MKILKGLPISSGIAYGKVNVIKNIKHTVSSQKIDPSNIKKHLKMFDKAIEKSLKELEIIISFLEPTAKDEKQIIMSHQEMLKDKIFLDKIKKTISKELYSAEFAIHKHFEKYIDKFINSQNEYLVNRKEDIKDIKNRIIKNLSVSKSTNKNYIKPGKIIVSEEITPSFILDALHKDILGFITEKGTSNSHSAIIARSIGLPVVFNVKNAVKLFAEDNFIIIDGSSGIIILDPTKKKLLEYKEKKEKEDEELALRIKTSKLPAITRDKHRIQLWGNIEFPEEARRIEIKNSDGIGLFRTEYLYFLENRFPSVNHQYKEYRNIIDTFSDKKPIYIRVFDIGGDKLNKEFRLSREKNPYLGCRGIRFLLKYPKIFEEQLKSILKASVYGNLKIMLPMISKTDEVIRSLDLINQVKNDLNKEKIKYDKNIQVGIMVEIPSAVLIAKELAKICDFFSIGTNDLMQYIFAADRNNEEVISEFDYFHPALLQMIEKTISVGRKENIAVSLCGEMASDELAIPLLLGMGLENFSANGDSILKVKEKIKNYRLDYLKKKYNEFKYKSCAEIKSYYTKIFPSENK